MILRLIAFALGVVTALCSTVPRIVCGDIAYLFFPVDVLLCVVVVASVSFTLFQFVRNGAGITGRRVTVLFVSGFLIADLAINARGFDWTGDWIRFALFKSGLRSEQEAQIEGIPSLKTYYWREDGYSSIRLYFYLIYDPTDSVSSIRRGTKSSGVRCPLVDNRWMAIHWYLVETYNCVFDKDVPSDSVWRKPRE